MGAAAGFAVDRDDVEISVTQAIDLGDEALGEQLAAEDIHQVVEGVVAGDAILAGQEVAQEVHVGFAPVLDLDEIVGRSDGGAQDQKQDFREWVDHFDELSGSLSAAK
jgi:hypothetical protein